MRENYLLNNKSAEIIYDEIKALPILDYHCHLSITEIIEDKIFDNIGKMWLGGDHYKWRLMRQAGIDEKHITGDAPWKEKFKKYAQVAALAGGNPLFNWNAMELSMYFDIDTPLNGDTADEIFDRAQKYIEANQLSPRKLIKKADVKYIATTDDPADTLDFHRNLQGDKDFDVFIAPAFRPDNLFNIHKNEFTAYVERFGSKYGIKICNLSDLRIALRLSLDEFVSLGCTYSDIGIEKFPTKIYSRDEASEVFIKALNGNEITDCDCDIYIGYMYNFLAGECKRHEITMQLHLSSKRDANSLLTDTCGRDAGSDCVGDIVEVNKLVNILDTLTKKDKLPKTIIYTLNPLMNGYMASVCGTFKDVVPGAAWWFCDHKRGILDVMEAMAEQGYFGSFMGMLTDSRSFLSYARHDYFRRILASLIGKWIEEDDFSVESGKLLAYKISYGNTYDRISPRMKEVLARNK